MDYLIIDYTATLVNNGPVKECRMERSTVGNIFWHIMQFSWGKGQSHQQLTLPHGVAVQLTASGSLRDAGRKSEQSVISLLSPQDTTAVLAHGQSGRQIGAAEPTSFLPQGPRGEVILLGWVEWKLQGKDGTVVAIGFPLVSPVNVFQKLSISFVAEAFLQLNQTPVLALVTHEGFFLVQMETRVLYSGYLGDQI